MFSAKMFSICMRYSDNREDAQDVFQDGFIVIFKKINQFRFEGSFEGWMRRIMVNSCISRHRTKNYLYVVNEEITEDYTQAESEVQSQMHDYTYDELLNFIRQLPDRYRQVFNMYAIDKYSHQQIAEELNISVGTSKSNLHRAREKLMELIKKDNLLKIVSK